MYLAYLWMAWLKLTKVFFMAWKINFAKNGGIFPAKIVIYLNEHLFEGQLPRHKVVETRN